MNTQPRIPARALYAGSAVLAAVSIFVAGVGVGKMNAPAPTPAPTVTHVVPQQSHECREAAEWYYEGFVAMVAESAELVKGTRTADEQWLSERIGPLLNEQEGIYWNQYRVCQGLEPVEFDQ